MPLFCCTLCVCVLDLLLVCGLKLWLRQCSSRIKYAVLQIVALRRTQSVPLGALSCNSDEKLFQTKWLKIMQKILSSAGCALSVAFQIWWPIPSTYVQQVFQFCPEQAIPSMDHGCAGPALMQSVAMCYSVNLLCYYNCVMSHFCCSKLHEQCC